MKLLSKKIRIRGREIRSSMIRNWILKIEKLSIEKHILYYFKLIISFFNVIIV